MNAAEEGDGERGGEGKSEEEVQHCRIISIKMIWSIFFKYML